MKTTIINHKRYTVDFEFNMVGNWYFTDKNGIHHLVDAEDVLVWAEEQGKKYLGIDTAIEYAKYLADGSDTGEFWWKVKGGK